MSGLASALGEVEEDVRLQKAAEALPLLSEADLVARLVQDRGLQTANNNAAIRICAAKHFTECLRVLVANPRVNPMVGGGSAFKELLREYSSARKRAEYGAENPEFMRIKASLLILLSSPKVSVKLLDPVTQGSLDEMVLHAMDDGDAELALGLLRAGAYAAPIILVNKATRLGYSIQFAVELEKYHGFSLDSIDINRNTLLWLLQDPELFKRLALGSYAPNRMVLELLSSINDGLSDEQQEAVLQWIAQPERQDAYNAVAARYAAAARAAAGEDDDDLYS